MAYSENINKDISSELEAVIEKIKKKIPVKKIILFGSYAYGKPGKTAILIYV